jgi:hypothetical protein
MQITPAAAAGQASPAAGGGRVARARRPRQVASWTSLAFIAVLLTACSSSTSSAASSTNSAPSTSSAASSATGTGGPVSTSGTSITASAAPASSTAAPGTPTASPSVAAPTGTSTFLASAQDLNGPLLHQPVCDGFGCALSGDSTAFLFHMTWSTWSGSEAVGTGTYKLDDCNPNCAGGHVYPVAAVVTLSQPVKVCSSSGTRWVWTHASFTFPQGLPKALQGADAPQNPWTFSGLITAARQTCAS